LCFIDRYNMQTEFRTTFEVAPPPFLLSHRDPVLLVGSCFANHLGAYLQQRQFQVLQNPYGISYNPISIARAALAEPLTEDRFFEREGIWRHWDLHSEWAHPERTGALARAAEAQDKARLFLQKTNVLLLTLGTAEVFELLTDGSVVANCHKAPAQHFRRKRLDVHACTAVLTQAIETLRRSRPALKVVLTVSPVRHLRMGAVEQQRSKAVLLLACEAVTQALPDTFYFPAYELLMDDLRDYRFYADDMVHPSEKAVAYICGRFADLFFDEQTRDLNRRIDKIRQALAHKPFYPDTTPHRAFVEKTKQQIQQLETEFPWIPFHW
jgi:hypothetical protein